MNEGQVMNAMVQAMAWIIGIGTAALGVLLVAIGRWIVGHIEGLRKTVSEEMRAFDVRISKLETIARMRGSEIAGDIHPRRSDERSGEDD